MSEETPTQTTAPQPPADDKPPVSPAPKPVKPAKSRQGPLWLAIILLLLGLVALAAVTALQWQHRETVEQRLDQLQSGLDGLQGQRDSASDQIEQRLDRLQAAQRQQNEAQRSLEQRIEQASRSLLQMGNRTRNDWLLAEAEYLIRIANQRLRMERDVGGAQALLENADQVLRESEDMGAYPVRQQLAREIQQLQGVDQVDRVGLYLQLEAAIDQVQNLEAASLADTAPLPAAPGESEADAGGNDNPLVQAWESTKQTLSEVIVIRRLDEPVQAPLSPRQSLYANLNLRLMLEEAEMALLNEDPVLYRRALAKAGEWLEQWYDAGENNVQALLQTLQQLADREIRPELPDISESLALIKARINGRLESDNGANGSAGGDSGEGEGAESQ